MLAYVTIIPAILFLVIEPYNRNRFVRFHSFQCIFVAIAWIVLSVAMRIVAAMIPFLGWLFYFMLIPLVGLAGLLLFLLLLYQAYQGKMFKLPIVGDMAEKQANAM